MLNNVVFSFLAIAGTLTAAEGLSALRPPDLKQLSKEQFQQLLSKAFEPPASAATTKTIQLARGEKQAICSIPLLEVKASSNEHFKMPQLRGGKMSFDRIAIPTPAPACKGWNEDK